MEIGYFLKGLTDRYHPHDNCDFDTTLLPANESKMDINLPDECLTLDYDTHAYWSNDISALFYDKQKFIRDQKIIDDGGSVTARIVIKRRWGNSFRNWYGVYTFTPDTPLRFEVELSYYERDNCYQDLKFLGNHIRVLDNIFHRDFKGLKINPRKTYI